MSGLDIIGIDLAKKTFIFSVSHQRENQPEELNSPVIS